MRQYEISFCGVPQGKIGNIPTPTLMEMLEYIRKGEPLTISEKDNTTREAVEDQIVLELEIRAWRMK